MSIPHVIIVGAGSTGAATAHDLALRGLGVTVIERGEVASGTTGHTLSQNRVRDRASDALMAGCVRPSFSADRVMCRWVSNTRETSRLRSIPRKSTGSM